MGKEEDQDLERALLPNSTVKVEKTEPVPIRKSRGGCSCCKIFCYIILAIVLFFILITTILGVWGYRTVRHEVIRFSITEPKNLPVATPIPERECVLLQDEAKVFFDKILAGHEPENDLSIAADKINGCFIAHSDYLNGNAWVSIEEDRLTVDMSLPAEIFPGGKGRYFVATETAEIHGSELEYEVDTPKPIDGVDGALVAAGFTASHHDDAHRWVVNILHGKFLNWEIPQDVIDERKDIFEEMYDDEDTATVLEAIERISLDTDGKITIHARRGN